MPDPKTGKRKVEPDWSQWTRRRLVSNVGPVGQPAFVMGSIEAHSAIVPGLCEKRAWVNIALATPEGELVTLEDGDVERSDRAPRRARKR
jgi:hypothetical protein